MPGCKHPRPYATGLVTKSNTASYLEVCRSCGASRRCMFTGAGIVSYVAWSPPARIELGRREVGKAYLVTLAADGAVFGVHTLCHGRSQRGSQPVWVRGRRISLAEIPVRVLAELPAKLKLLEQQESSAKAA